METTAEKNGFGKWICGLIDVLKSEDAIIFYHIIAYIVLGGFAFFNKNDMFIVGTIAAAACLCAELSTVAYLTDNIEWQNKAWRWVVKSFRLEGEIGTTPREYIFYMTLPTAILLLSSCLILMPPLGYSLCRPVAVIESSGANSTTVAGPSEAKLFVPGKQRVKWFYADQIITNISMVLQTKDGKKVQATATVHFRLKLEKDRRDIKKVCREFGSNAELRNRFEMAVKSALEKTFLSYNLAALPSQFAIEDQAWSGLDLKKFSIISGYVELSDMHRYSEPLFRN